MLDDGQYVFSIDRGNALGLVAGQPKQLKQVFTPQLQKPAAEIRNIVWAGMGGSALAAEFAIAWLSTKLTLPLIVVRGYNLPAFVNEHSLVFVSSYSGNTEETLSIYDQLKGRGSKVVVFSAGGQLVSKAQTDKIDHIPIISGSQPRLSVFQMVKAFAASLEALGMLVGGTKELEEVADWLDSHITKWVQTVPQAQNPAKQIAEQLLGNAVVIYGGPTLAAAAQKWKISINENAKNLAFHYYLPEFNHNEFQGWFNPQTKAFKVVELQSSLDKPPIRHRWDISNRLLSGKMPNPIIVQAEGETKLQQLLWAQMLGDFVGVYLGVLNKVDPASVDLIEKLKKELQ